MLYVKTLAQSENTEYLYQKCKLLSDYQDLSPLGTKTNQERDDES